MLIVDDDADICSLMVLHLQKNGFPHANSTANANSAIDKVRRRAADVLILDWHMPQVTGLEILQVIRSFDKEIPIVMFTTESREEQIREALTSGVTDYLLKHVGSKNVVRKVREVLEKQAAQEQDS